MLANRIIPCLDVKDGKVVKGVKFKYHQVLGEIVPMAAQYAAQGADELVFYDITASCEQRTVAADWVSLVAREIDIPFCVAGGIDCVDKARALLAAGADKISVNTPALQNPELINQLASEFGRQCVVVGVDSFAKEDDYYVYQFTGDPDKTVQSSWKTRAWLREVQQRGAGEIVLNCINQDGVQRGYDLAQIRALSEVINVPLVASGGAGATEHFRAVLAEEKVTGALAASVFHQGEIVIAELKSFLIAQNIEVRR